MLLSKHICLAGGGKRKPFQSSSTWGWVAGVGARFESGTLKMKPRAGQGIGALGSHFSSLVKHSWEPWELRTSQKVLRSKRWNSSDTSHVLGTAQRAPASSAPLMLELRSCTREPASYKEDLHPGALANLFSKYDKGAILNDKMSLRR